MKFRRQSAMVSSVANRVLAPPDDAHIEGRTFRGTRHFRDSRALQISLVLAAVLAVASVLYVRWIREPDPFSAGAARETLASLGSPVPGATVGSQFSADWPRSGPGIAFITAGRAYHPPGRLTVGDVVRDFKLWGDQHGLGPVDAETPFCADTSRQGYDGKPPGVSGLVCGIGVRAGDQPFQRISISIMFEGSGPHAASPRPGDPWTKCAGDIVSQVVVDVTVTEERPIPNTD